MFHTIISQHDVFGDVYSRKLKKRISSSSQNQICTNPSQYLKMMVKPYRVRKEV